MWFELRLKRLQFEYDISLNPVRWLFLVPEKAKSKTKLYNTPEYKVPPHFQRSEQLFRHSKNGKFKFQDSHWYSEGKVLTLCKN